jgi:hypothetical protein
MQLAEGTQTDSRVKLFQILSANQENLFVPHVCPDKTYRLISVLIRSTLLDRKDKLDDINCTSDNLYAIADQDLMVM